jgi:hypothetical protein
MLHDRVQIVTIERVADRLKRPDIRHFDCAHTIPSSHAIDAHARSRSDLANPLTADG